MRFLAIFFLLFFSTNFTAQGCCSGGAGSPIAGGAATGVLQKNQMQMVIFNLYMEIEYLDPSPY